MNKTQKALLIGTSLAFFCSLTPSVQAAPTKAQVDAEVTRLQTIRRGSYPSYEAQARMNLEAAALPDDAVRAVVEHSPYTEAEVRLKIAAGDKDLANSLEAVQMKAFMTSTTPKNADAVRAAIPKEVWSNQAFKDSLKNIPVDRFKIASLEQLATSFGLLMKTIGAKDEVKKAAKNENFEETEKGVLKYILKQWAPLLVESVGSEDNFLQQLKRKADIESDHTSADDLFKAIKDVIMEEAQNFAKKNNISSADAMRHIIKKIDKHIKSDQNSEISISPAIVRIQSAKNFIQSLKRSMTKEYARFLHATAPQLRTAWESVLTSSSAADEIRVTFKQDATLTAQTYNGVFDYHLSTVVADANDTPLKRYEAATALQLMQAQADVEKANKMRTAIDSADKLGNDEVKAHADFKKTLKSFVILKVEQDRSTTTVVGNDDADYDQRYQNASSQQLLDSWRAAANADAIQSLQVTMTPTAKFAVIDGADDIAKVAALQAMLTKILDALPDKAKYISVNNKQIKTDKLIALSAVEKAALIAELVKDGPQKIFSN